MARLKTKAEPNYLLSINKAEEKKNAKNHQKQKQEGGPHFP